MRDKLRDMRTKCRTCLVAAIVVSTFHCNVTLCSDTEEIKVIVERNVPVPMRDGTILRADVHRPDRGGPYPVLVRRTPYNKEFGMEGYYARFVQSGYIVVSQDVRGRYESAGEWESVYRFQTHDAEDGYDTVEWAAKLVGSNGRVGTIGVSYEAFLQWRLAPLRPPSLLSMSFSGIDAQHFVCEMGVMPCEMLEWWVKRSSDMRHRVNQPGVHTRWEAERLLEVGEREKWLNFRPRLQLPRDLFEYEEEAVKFLWKNPHLDPWRLDEGCKDISVPIFEVAGWYDPGKGDMALYKTIVKQGRTEVARSGSHIIIGPWIHGGSTSRSCGDFDFGPNAGKDIIAVQARWFDYWLKGIQNGVDEDAPVRIFVMGDNIWRDEQCWPLKHTKERVLFLTSEGSANTPKKNGQLVEKAQQSLDIDRYEYNPENPVPWSGEAPVNRNRSALADREDILVYETEPLAERLEVTGNPVVELYASSSAPDTDWYVWLIDVSPNNLAREVSEGKVRARYRDGLDTPKFLKPGEVIKYIIRMSPTSNAFLAGHRIRVDVSSSNFPKFEINHNTAADQAADATLAIANQTIYHGGKWATRIILPWVPNQPEEEKHREEEKVEQESEKRIYPLHQAAVDGDIEQVKQLISKGVNVNAKDEEENPPLHYAVQSGKIEIVQLLVEAGADVNVNAESWPPLYEAVKNDHMAVAEYLVAHGADVNPDNGWTPLQQAPYSSSIEMIKLLIANGADVKTGPWTALHGAVAKGRSDMVELLIQKGADINAKDKNGMIPLSSAISTNKREIAELLLANGAEIGDLSLKDDRGLTTLHNAAVKGHQEIAKLLLAKGAKVDERDDNYEFTALHYAARFGNKDVAEVLIANGADIKAEDKWDYQPIHWAAYHDRPDIIELLIAKGADVNAKTSLGQTPIQLAKPRRNTAAIEVLRKHGAKE
jgi:putative CocE/NonD family hydrolase